MELIRHDTNFDFVGKRNLAIGISWLLILIGVVSLVVKGGPSYGIDFAGGTLVQIKFTEQTSAADLRSTLGDLDLRGLTIQQVGDQGNEFLVRVQESNEKLETLATNIQAKLEKKYGSGKLEIRRTEMVGPQVGKDLRNKGVQAILFSIVGMLIYITFRFEFRFGLGAIVATLHDVLITLGLMSLLNLEIDLTVIAGFLALVGYSVNDTVIVCDRIRENMGKLHTRPLAEIVNRSINETLSRTIMTSGLTLLSVVALYTVGGSVIHNFAFVLMVGIIIGTYSSIFVASPIILIFERFRHGKNVVKKDAA
jgi:preprotein translocase subunit SecF